MTDPPAFRVHGEPCVRLTPRGCRMVLAALDAALKLANRSGVDYRGRSQFGEFETLREVCRLGAQPPSPTSGVSPDGTTPVPFRVTLPSSGPIPELLTTREAASILGITRRAVRKRITAGDLPARRYGRELLMLEYDVRHAARNGRRHAEPDTRQAAPVPRDHTAGGTRQPGAASG